MIQARGMNAMIKSMTGYGRGEQQFDGYRICIEIKSVNNRYLDYNVRVYRQYAFLEEMVRDCLPGKISRGKVDVSITFDNIRDDGRVVTINQELARGYYDALKTMGAELELQDDLTISKFAGLPDIFTIEKKEQDREQITADAKQVLLMALEDLTQNRQREGARLYTFFADCTAELERILQDIDVRSPITVTEYRAKIKARIEELLEDTTVEESRLLTEVAIFADKVNVTEELVRFRSHLKEFRLLLESDEPVGRKLEFVLQELNREANTIGSKCNDFSIARLVVDVKANLEKLREQVQNIE